MTDSRFAERGENLQSRALRDTDESTDEVREEDTDEGRDEFGRDEFGANEASGVDDVTDAPETDDDVDRDALGEKSLKPGEPVQRQEPVRSTESDSPAVFGGDAFGRPAADPTSTGTDADTGMHTDTGTDSSIGTHTDADTDTGIAAGPKAGAPAVAGEKPAARFFEDTASEKLRDRWQSIQIDFVDDPRHAVEQAETLVEQVSTQLTKAIAARRSELHGRWSRDGAAASAAHDNGVATEDLRTALQEYRRVLNQLLTL